MSDIVRDAKAWLADVRPRRIPDGRTHHATCHETHIECLVERLVAEVERHRMTQEERAGVAWASRESEEWANENDDEHDKTHGERALALRAFLERTAPKRKEATE